MKICILGQKSGRPTPFIVFDDADMEPAADATREWCIREAIKDDPSLTRADAVALYRQALREASAQGFIRA
jgi:hypothetical protein